MMFPGTPQIITRGTTVQFSTNFYDVNGSLIQPDSATINIVYYSAANGTQETAEVSMSPPGSGQTAWTALWDTRNVAGGFPVAWSIHTGTNDPVPVTVGDGQFQLSANPANLATF
jgi:hypothetical protein